MMNGIGLGLLTRRKNSNMIIFSGVLMCTSVTLLSTAIIANKKFNEEQIKKIVDVGFGTAITGWAMMAIC